MHVPVCERVCDCVWGGWVGVRAYVRVCVLFVSNAM